MNTDRIIELQHQVEALANRRYYTERQLKEKLTRIDNQTANALRELQALRGEVAA